MGCTPIPTAAFQEQSIQELAAKEQEKNSVFTRCFGLNVRAGSVPALLTYSGLKFCDTRAKGM